jgi:hypothetical protein
VNGLLRLFTHPALLLVPTLAVAGGVLACRMGGAPRFYAAFVALVLALQYAVNTFVLVLPPNVRYFATALVLTCPLAGHALAALPRRVSMLTALVLLLPAVAVSATQPRPAALLPAMEEFAGRTDGMLYVSSYAYDVAYLALRRGDLTTSSIRVGPPVPTGGFAMWNSIGWPAGMREERCADGVPRWEVEAERPPPGLLGGVIKHVASWTLVPDWAARLLRQYDDATVLLRRRC